MSWFTDAFGFDGSRITERVLSIRSLIERQIDLAQFPFLHRHTRADTNRVIIADDNTKIWKLFNEEHLYDTRRVTLEHFHLFEWFPQSPGLFHSEQGKESREYAFLQERECAHDRLYFRVDGKLSMLEGGVGAVRLRPRQLRGDDMYYFMTASSSSVCHEGFPVVLPRRLYGDVKRCILEFGAAPVTLSGEMRYIPKAAVDLFQYRRDIPLLYLHVDCLQVLPQPRSEVTRFAVSGAVLFTKEEEDYQATYATFDPASPTSIEKACTWIEKFYIEELYQGRVVTDFDEVKTRFPNAVFGLPKVMCGQIDPKHVRLVLGQAITDEQVKTINYNISRYYIDGDITVGDVIGDYNVIGHGSSQA